jgi:WD40 repeat protein
VNLISCLAWSKKLPNIVASGSTEKEIKIWSISASNDIDERLRMSHVDGAA